MLMSRCLSCFAIASLSICAGQFAEKNAAGEREVGWHKRQLSLHVKEEAKCFVELLVFLFVLTHSTPWPSFATQV